MWRCRLLPANSRVARTLDLVKREVKRERFDGRVGKVEPRLRVEELRQKVSIARIMVQAPDRDLAQLLEALADDLEELGHTLLAVGKRDWQVAELERAKCERTDALDEATADLAVLEGRQRAVSCETKDDTKDRDLGEESARGRSRG